MLKLSYSVLVFIFITLKSFREPNYVLSKYHILNTFKMCLWDNSGENKVLKCGNDHI